jgi:hypothetical protein
VNCPKCQAAITSDFGMVICPSCAAALYIDMDGNIQLSEPQSATSRPLEQVLNDTFQQPVLDSIETSDLPEPSVTATFTQTEISIKKTPEQNVSNNEYSEEVSRIIQAEINENSSLQEHLIDPPSNPAIAITTEEKPMFPLIDFAKAPESPVDTAVTKPKKSQPKIERNPLDLSLGEELTRFANEENSGGPLTYSVRVSGLDMDDNLNHLMQVLIDPKLNLDFVECQKRISQGVLIIDKLNPAQAVVLVNKLKSAPVKLEWEQFLYDA